MKNNKYSFLLLLTSILNWFPIIIYVFIYPPLPFSLIFLVLSFFSPVIAITYILITIIMIILNLLKIKLGGIVIIVNVLYLIWSKYYLNVLYHMT